MITKNFVSNLKIYFLDFLAKEIIRNQYETHAEDALLSTFDCHDQ